jgi:hypothetical protein
VATLQVRWLHQARVGCPWRLRHPDQRAYGKGRIPIRKEQPWRLSCPTLLSPGPPGVGSHGIMTRRIGGSERTSTSAITELSPPRTWAIHGIDGPIRADVAVTVEPRQDGTQSHVTIQLDFSGSGMGQVILPMVIRQARKEVPQSCLTLKNRLESYLSRPRRCTWPGSALAAPGSCPTGRPGQPTW